jgi:hypothetical protein
VHITERWEYLTIAQVPDDQVDSVRDSYAELGYEEVERSPGRLVVRKEFPVTGQIAID